jgi:hypothetical protein
MRRDFKVRYTPGEFGCVDIIGDGISWLTGKMIRGFTHSGYDHAFIITSGDGDIVEARPGGARRSHISEYDGLKMIFSSTDMTADQRNGIIETANTCTGTGYGYLDICYLGLYLKGFQNKYLFDLVTDENRMICSQLVAYCGDMHGVEEWLCGKSHSQLVTPGNLADLTAAQEKRRFSESREMFFPWNS